MKASRRVPLTPLPVAAAARGAVALALPLLVGVTTGHVVPAVLAGIGALWGVSQDGADPYRLRVRRLACTGAAAALGLLAGELALRSGRPGAVTVCLAAVALLAGSVSLRGPLASVAGLHLLLGATVGGGIPVPGPWWQAPLALLAGVGLVVVLSTAPWLWRRHAIERATVRAVYGAAAEALAAAGSPGAEAARRRLTSALDDAHRVMGRHLTGRVRPGTELSALRTAFDTAVRLGEVASALVWEGRALPLWAVRVPPATAARLLPPTGRTAPREPDSVPAPAPHTAAVPVTVQACGPDGGPHSPGLRALAGLCAQTVPPARAEGTAARLPAQPWHGRAAQVRYAVLLTGCVLVAQLCAGLLHGPRGYWLPMTVAFVYKPDFGPVLRRALHRCAGTVAGVAAIGAVTLLTTGTYALIGAVAAFGALMAVGVRHHYALATTALTAVVFVLVDLLGDHRALYSARILDTALAAAVVLVAHFALWPDSARGRALARTEAALAAARRYADLAPGAAPAQRHALRRGAYHGLAEARRALAHARLEPGRPGRGPAAPAGLPGLEDAVTEAERLCDAVSARSLGSATAASTLRAPRCTAAGAMGG
ncbi:FUSC family protein [Streptomyces sp. NRRL S-340]|uniref:FUSC family protein n=1 Tax=Streptomyces sp. NRRL S-340 TaxID=1463901 RepID=UPI000560FAB4|nr:FUSC family protein [Streptomyces sp. NRRL S-340]